MNYHSFDDELVSELPSCVYANQHLGNTPQDSVNASNLNATVGSRAAQNICGINVSNLRQQLHNPYGLQHHSNDFMDTPSTSTSSPVNLSTASNISTFGGCSSPYKIQRQQTNVRERKRIMRSAPNGYN